MRTGHEKAQKAHEFEVSRLVGGAAFIGLLRLFVAGWQHLAIPQKV
jgi:hypothetical protein